MDRQQSIQSTPLPQAPVRFTVTSESVLLTSNDLCSSAQQVVNGLISTVTPAEATFDNVLKVLLQHENDLLCTSRLMTVYSLVATDPQLRSAAANASDKIWHFLTDCKTNLDLFHLVDALYQRHKDDCGLDVESRKALIEERRAYVRLGTVEQKSSTGTPGPTVRDIAKRLTDLASEFMRNLDEKEHAVWLTRQELAGVSDDVLASMEAGTGDMDGKVKLDLTGMQSRWLLTMVSSPATRERIYRGTKQVARENVPLFHEAVRLRHQSAQLLGYPSHLAYNVDARMAKTPAAVMNFLNDVRRRVIRELPEDYENLLQLKGNDPSVRGQPNADVLLWSDIPYYSRVFEEQHYSVDQGLIAEYFPLYQTVSKMLALFGRLFGFDFRELTTTADRPTASEQTLVWHPDVMLYSVWNDEQEGGEFAGYLYLDLHPRPGKAGGAQCRPLQPGFERPDGQRHYPSTVLLTNFAKPTADEPTLLQHSEVVLLFHELGHGIHDLAGRCKYARFHGAETVVDFNETPSQMLENWCWDAGALRHLSGHHQTGQVLPDAVIESLLRTRVVLPAMKLLPQLRMTLFDTIVHSTDPLEDGSIDVAEIYADYAELGGIKNIGDEYGYASYRHLFSGNDAGMYGYLWSNVLAMDMFDTVFKQDPLDDKAGRRYRHTVLEKGASRAEMDTLVQFLGRKPSSEAFYRSIGLNT